MRRHIFFSTALLLASPASPATFNDVVPGARAMGIGMAYTSIAEGPEGIYFNPAGLAGSDFTQVQGSAGRMISPLGLLAYETMAYTRPLPVIPGATVGTAFFMLRQNDGGDKDVFFLHGSYLKPFPQIYLKRPVKFGANLRIMDVDPGEHNKKFGLGLDVGAIMDTGGNFKAGASITDIDTISGIQTPSLNLGASYRLWRRATLAADMRVRPSLTQLFAGMEVDVYEQLLKLRLGKGMPLDGVSQVAFGVGANFSPLIIDFAMGVPFSGINRKGGGCQIGFTYKFGAPAFYGRYIGSAARRAEDIRSDILELENRKKTLEAEAAAAEADRTSSETMVRTLQERMKELQDRIREAEFKLERAEYDLSHAQPKPPSKFEAPPAPAPRPKPPAGPAFPRKHVVKPGDTLRSISREHYGDPTLWEKIFEANPDKIDRGLPVEGAVLTIPRPQ
ncbi:MAG: LysM peptidoglycan-binding domain-containing protein [Elusimicrobia bacterium]|nr:LysM peptidoglycan-binding domain-containing protein [Elusimicrobiota bacterium]